jgi:hypothetical protein
MKNTLQPPFLTHAIADKLVKFTGEGRTERIQYLAADHSERWADPEEKVRAEFWAELIYKYEYRPERIRFEVKVPRRTPNDLADLVIYGDKDDELKAPYFVFECKRADVSDAEFAQSIEQACGNRANLAAHFCGAIAGLTRRFLRFDKFPPGERDKTSCPTFPFATASSPTGAFTRVSRATTWSPSRAKNYAPPSANATRPFGKVDAAAPSPPSASSAKSSSSNTATRRTANAMTVSRIPSSAVVKKPLMNSPSVSTSSTAPSRS